MWLSPSGFIIGDCLNVSDEVSCTNRSLAFIRGAILQKPCGNPEYTSSFPRPAEDPYHIPGSNLPHSGVLVLVPGLVVFRIFAREMRCMANGRDHQMGSGDCWLQLFVSPNHRAKMHSRLPENLCQCWKLMLRRQTIIDIDADTSEFAASAVIDDNQWAAAGSLLRSIDSTGNSGTISHGDLAIRFLDAGDLSTNLGTHSRLGLDDPFSEGVNTRKLTDLRRFSEVDTSHLFPFWIRLRKRHPVFEVSHGNDGAGPQVTAWINL
ncbi:hypothetical protein KC361_g228 [Hortaea werneckii]|nr:hypothetical protein KC361_g228 [Hortaea werneckii]